MKPPHQMARPGFTLSVSGDASGALTLIEQAFLDRGFTTKTSRGGLPAELSHGSARVNFLSDVVSDIALPLFALPSVWKKRHAMKVRFYALEPAAASFVLRVDMRSAELSASTTSYFMETVGIAVENIRAHGLAVEIEGPTDSGKK
jgi:hypothetical protein